MTDLAAERQKNQGIQSLDYNPANSTGRNIREGNRCGADIRVRYKLPKYIKNRTALLNNAKNKLSEFPYHQGSLYWEDKQAFYTRKSWRGRFLSDRQERSESRWAFHFMGSLLLDYVDCYTFSLGKWDERSGQFHPYTLKHLWSKLVSMLPDGMDFSYSRFKREWSRLKKMGFVRTEKKHYTFTHPVTREKMTRQDVALKYLTPKFFHNLNITSNNLKEAKADSKDRVIRTLRNFLYQEVGPLKLEDANQLVRKMLANWKDYKGQCRLWWEEQCKDRRAQAPP